KEDVASSSLVTRSSLRSQRSGSEDLSECAVAWRRRTADSFKLWLASHFSLAAWPSVAISSRHFFESKPTPGCISLPKDEYENIASLHLLGCAGCYGHGATCTPASSSAIPGGFGVDDGQRLAHSGSGG